MRVWKVKSEFHRCHHCDKTALFCIATNFAGKIHLCMKCAKDLEAQLTKLTTKGTDENLPRKASW